MTAERRQQIERLLHAALELDAAQRAPFLAHACSSDEALRREVEALLRRHEQDEHSTIPAQPLNERQSGLPVGHQVRHYRILSLLGAGGMGEVYLAEDTLLGRKVALKLLPRQFTQDRDRVRRFEQEARAASALNHPGIITIHEFGQVDEWHYIVTEFIDGQTLRGKITREPLRLHEALEIATQVAEALAAAHSAGIVHRDIKPENIMVRPDRLVKVLDFGLAKLVEQQSSAPDVHVLTGASIGTHPGMVIGTARYMSPEQVRGEKLDARTDIFSLGVVLYEMLAGQRPFQGRSAVEVMNAILTEDPPKLPETKRESRGGPEQIPLALERVVRRCLEKRPELRFQSASDLAFALKGLSELSGVSVTAPAQTPEGRKPRLWATPAIAALMTASVMTALFGAWWVLGRLGRRVSTPAIRVYRLTDFVGLEEFPAISPDGKSVAFTAEDGGKRQVWMRLLAGGPPLQITRDGADHLYPRWSPDASSLIYYSPSAEAEGRGALWEISALGGSPRRITSSTGGADLSHDGTRITFFRLNDGQLELTIATRDGSGGRAVARVATNFRYSYPRWSPGDEWIGYQRNTLFDDDVFVAPARGGEPRRVIHDRCMLNGFTWTADGKGIVYSSSRGSTILYLPAFNLWAALLAGGGPRQLTFGESSYIQPDLTHAGALIASRMRMQFNIWKYPVKGLPRENVASAVQITRQTGLVQTPSVGPGDREMVYLSESGGHGNLWVMKLDGGETRQITFERDPDRPIGVPVWSPDGKHIAFVVRSASDQDVDLWLISPDGSNTRKVEENAAEATWSSDGHWLYYYSKTTDQIKRVPVEGGQPEVVRRDSAHSPAVAPDGSALYFKHYSENVNAPDIEIHVARPESGPTRLLARIPGSRVPAWQIIHPVISPDGKWLALLLTDAGVTNIWALSTSDGTLRQITDFSPRRTFIARRVSWSSDGTFIFASLGEGDADVVLLDGLAP